MTTDCSKLFRHHAEFSHNSRSRSLLRITVRKNGNVLDDDKRVESKYLFMLHMVSKALIKNGVKTYRGFDANA